MVLQNVFTKNLFQFTDNEILVNELWIEIEKHYNEKYRFYHTLKHIQDLYFLLEKNKDLIEDWETLIVSIFYHDIIYDAKSNNNEEQSAELMRKVMLKIDFSKEKIEKSYQQILATKKHEITGDNDTDLFTDADISILGSEWEIYQAYAKNIRKEYSIYPDFLYNMGRTKVLKHFLTMPDIYKTSLFRAQFETKARENLERELQLLK